MTDEDAILPSDETGEVPEIPEVELQEATEPDVPTEEDRFLVRDWKGHAAFLCRHCPFSTLRREEIEAHCRTHEPHE